MAFCPVCQASMRTRAGLCPHVAVVVPPGQDLYGDLYIGGYLKGRAALEILELQEVLTHIGCLLDGSHVYFAPAPRVFLQALEESTRSGRTIQAAYQHLWRLKGMEDHAWHGKAP